MGDRDCSEVEAMDCLMSCSSLCYHSLLAGPTLLNKLTPSRWENVRPCAAYNLTNLHTALNNLPRKRTKRNSSNQFLLTRGTVSLPNLRSKAGHSHKEFIESYMSGYVDENFSYVYPGGLSERSGAIQEHKLYKETPLYHHNMEPVQRQTSHSVSTHTLTLDSVFASRLYAAAQMDARTRNEISRIVAMQLRSDVLAEQLIMENRLRNLDLNAFPVLGMRRGGVNNLESERGSSLTKHGFSISAPPMINSASHMQTQRLQSHNQRKKREKRQKRQESKASLEWCPLGCQELQCITDSPFNSPERKKVETSTHNLRVKVGSLRGSGLSELLGVGSIAPKQSASTRVQPQKVSEKSEKRSRRSLTYFGQERFALENSLPKSEHNDHPIPVIVPMLDREQATRTKRFNSKLTTLHRLSLSKLTND